MATAQGRTVGLIEEWKPTRRTWFAWWGIGGAMAVMGGFAYLSLAAHALLPDSFEVSVIPVIVLSLAVVGVHEAIHGVVMMVFGARPTFGILRSGGIFQGFYTTADGYRFTRNAYLLVALAPTISLAALGIPLCWSPLGSLLWVPFGVHLGGCVGDLTIAAHVLAAPAGSQVEDLRDGIRIWRGPSVA